MQSNTVQCNAADTMRCNAADTIRYNTLQCDQAYHHHLIAWADCSAEQMCRTIWLKEGIAPSEQCLCRLTSTAHIREGAPHYCPCCPYGSNDHQ